jgi:hypothetical protein
MFFLLPSYSCSGTPPLIDGINHTYTFSASFGSYSSSNCASLEGRAESSSFTGKLNRLCLSEFIFPLTLNYSPGRSKDWLAAQVNQKHLRLCWENQVLPGLLNLDIVWLK